MIHLGDITKISGHTAPIVDCVIGGSPCQDLSMAGKRAGLDGERSGLFMEQIRIIKEMRAEDERRGNADVDIRPRYMVWENVPGAFSSNKGEDFRIVLEETAKVADKDAVIPRPERGKWATSGCIMGNGWSIAWRVLDSQFFGTSDKPLPQRRRRIALVADFGGHSASEILFVRQSVSGDTQPSQPKRKGASSDAEGSFGESDNERASCFGISSYSSNAMLSDNPHSGIYEADTSRTLDLNGGNPACNQGGIMIVEPTPYTLKIRSGCEGGGKGALIQTDKSATLSTLQDQTLFQPVLSVDQGGGKSACNIQEGQAPTLTCTHGGEPAVCYSIENHPADSRVDIDPTGKVQTLTSRMGTGGGNVPMVMKPMHEGTEILNPWDSQGNQISNGTGKHIYPCLRGCGGGGYQQGYVLAETANPKGDVIALDRAAYNQGINAQYDFEVSENGINSTIVAKGPGAVCYGIDQQGGKGNASYAENVSPTICSDSHGTPHAVCYGTTNYIVRRLTPLECERLQGFPDNWTLIGEPTQKVVSDYDEDTGEKVGEHIETEFYYTNSQGKRVKCSDSTRYKALGNSIALPPWKWVLKRLCACYERDATMASLFDGIGGFPYIWEQLNGKGSCLWASEIEEFPIAVTKARFGECT